MIQLYVVDRGVTSRSEIVNFLNQILEQASSQAQLLPQLIIKPLSLEEIRFSAAPELCIIGPEILTQDPTEVSRIRSIFPDSALFGMLDPEMNCLATCEQLARIGIDDFIDPSINGGSFLRKLVLLRRKKAPQSSGKLIVVAGGKGGVGVTSIVAGLGEALLDQGKQVVLIDLDHDTADLSRFLQVRPFVNEALQLLVNQSRPISAETVAECMQPIWSNELDLKVVTPCAQRNTFNQDSERRVRAFHGVLERIDAHSEITIVDCGDAQGALFELLCRAADQFIVVINNDPASMYASIQKLSQIAPLLQKNVAPAIVINRSDKFGLSYDLIKQEIERARALNMTPQFSPRVIPFCAQMMSWPGSGGTPFSESSRPVREGLEKLLISVGLSQPAPEANSLTLIDRIQQMGLALYQKHRPRRIPAAAAVPSTPVQESIALPVRELKQLPEPKPLLLENPELIITRAMVNSEQ